MIVSLLAAMDERLGIGLGNRLPWRQSSDLKRFKALTMGHHLIMGRRTYESIGRPLPGRTTIVVTRNPTDCPPGCLAAPSVEEALRTAESGGESEAFVIGGAQVFAAALPLADRMYLTRVHTQGPADVFFPDFDPDEWQVVEVSSHDPGPKDEHAYTYMTLERKLGSFDNPD